jgi:hypothetical protein
MIQLRTNSRSLARERRQAALAVHVTVLRVGRVEQAASCTQSVQATRAPSTLDRTLRVASQARKSLAL